MLSGWATLVAVVEFFLFFGGVAVLFFLLNHLFPPFKKLVSILVNADK